MDRSGQGRSVGPEAGQNVHVQGQDGALRKQRCVVKRALGLGLVARTLPQKSHRRQDRSGRENRRQTGSPLETADTGRLSLEAYVCYPPPSPGSTPIPCPPPQPPLPPQPSVLPILWLASSESLNSSLAFSPPPYWFFPRCHLPGCLDPWRCGSTQWRGGEKQVGGEVERQVRTEMRGCWSGARWGRCGGGRIGIALLHARTSASVSASHSPCLEAGSWSS